MIPPQLISAIAKYGPMALDFIGGQKGLKTEIERQAADEAAAMKGQLGPQYGVSDSWNKYLSMSRQDPAADLLRQQQAASEASNVGAMKAGGAKAIIGAGAAMAQQAAQNRAQIEADSFARQQSALQAYAGQEQRVKDENIKRAQGQFDTARKAGREAQDAKKQMWFDLGSTLLGQVGQGDFAGMFSGMKSGNGNDFSDALLVTKDYEKTKDQYPMLPFDDGGLVKTPGSFSHRANPIDIIRKGRKIGEMTGGETIFNPEQTQNMMSMSNGGDTDLHRYVRSLFRKFEQKR